MIDSNNNALFALNEDAIAPFFLSLISETILAEPAVSALTCSINLFDLINFEHCDNAWA